MNIIFTNKGTGTIPTEELIQIFEETDSIEEIKSAVENGEERVFATWASVDMKDQAGELIPQERIIEQQEMLLERNGPISEDHTNRIIGQTLAYKLLEHPETKTLGTLHLSKIFNHNKLDDKVWGEIQSGERKGSSVGGFNTRFSLGKDQYSGEDVKVLDDFTHLETASVKDPCVPFALNEAYSVVAKSNISKKDNIVTAEQIVKAKEEVNKYKRTVKKPEKLDRCVQSLMSDPKFEAQEGRTKEESAFAVCMAQINKIDPIKDTNKEESEKNKNVLNKCDSNKSNTDKKIKKGDSMTEDMKETISKLQEDVAKLKKQNEPEEEEEKKKTNKQEEEEKPKPEEEEPKEEEKKKSEVVKEEAKSDIDGETDAPQEEEPREDVSNEADVYKKELEAQKKELAKVSKMVTEMASTPKPEGTIQGVNKSANDYATKLAKGELGKPEIHSVHKMVREMTGVETK